MAEAVKEQEEHRYFSVRAKFRLVSWDDLAKDEVFYYFLKNRRDSEQEAHGPFLMVEPANYRVRNKQGVEIKFTTMKENLQAMILEGPEQFG